MPDQFYSGMRGTYAVSKLNELWGIVDESLNTGTALDAASGAASSAVLADLSAQAASGSASGAASSAVVAGEYLDSIINVFSSLDQKYLGAFSVDPVVDNQGNPILAGAVYYNTTDNILKFYNGIAWEEPSAAAAQSAIEALASAQAASGSASGAVLSAQAASGSASSAYISEINTANIFDQFDDRYLGAKVTAPTLDNDGNSLLLGSMYWNITDSLMYVWSGNAWIYVQSTQAAISASGSASGAASSAVLANSNAQAASGSASGAVVSAQAASGSASGAVLSAQAASGSASGAVLSAQAASGSASGAASSAVLANSRAQAASGSASGAASSAVLADLSAASAINTYTNFNKIYLGSFAEPPTTDNNGNALQIGSLYWNSDTNSLYLWDDQSWNAAAFSVSGAVISFNNRAGAVTLNSADVTQALGFTPYSNNSLDNSTIIDTNGTISLKVGYGDTLNPYASKTATHVLAAPSVENGTPSFRALTSGDIPTLNQDTTGSSARWSTPITLSLIGDISGSINFDGSSNVDLDTAININIDYNSLSNLPTLFSGSYTDLTDKPTIPDISGKLDLSGGTMTGTLVLSGDPVADLAAATKQYVDSATASVNISSIGDISDVLISSLQSGHILKYDGNNWINIAFTPGDILPDQTNNSGKFLTTNGTSASWGTILPYSSGTVSYQKQVFFASEGQTEFLITYTIAYVDVYLNGIKLIDTQDYSAINGTSIIMSVPVKQNDVIEVIKWENIPNSAYTRYLYTATSGQVEFIAEYYIDAVDVYLNGIKLIQSVQFIANNGTSITIPTTIQNDIIEIIAWKNIIPTNSANLVLPNQTGNSGYLLSTNGISASWIPYPSVFSGAYEDLTGKPTIPGNINDLNDVTITSVSNNQLLKYNGSAWVNISGPTGDLVGTTDVQTLSNKTIASYTESVYALSGTIINPSNGPIQTIVLSSPTTFTESLNSGQTVTLMVEHADVYTITWPTATWVTAQGNIEPTYTSNDVFIVWKINTTLYLSYAGSYA